MSESALDVQKAQVVSLGKNSARIILEPLEKGFGHTLGSSLRRVLLSSIVGAAVVEVSIEGVQHEYSSLDGVLEDVIGVLLNIKGIIIRLEGREEAVLNLSKKGKGLVLASDIELESGIEIVNPDHVIAHLTKEITLRMSLKIQSGMGYVATSSRLDPRSDLNALRLDASFSPIKRATYCVENTRVEERTDLDKLIIELETNGILTPEDAVQQAALLLQKKLMPFLCLSGEPTSNMRFLMISDTHSVLHNSIDDLGLPARATNCLKAEHILTVGDLTNRSEQDLLKTPHLGKRSLIEIRDALSKLGLSLNK